MSKILALFPAFNEEKKIGKAISSIPEGVVSEIVVVDDGSTDETARVARETGATVVANATRLGVGSSIRKGIDYARKNGFSIIVILAGNGKDDGRQIPLLTKQISDNGYDFVQGSRYLKGGHFGRMPLYRQVATRYIHPLLLSFVSGKRITDSTNGFRAIRLRIFDDTRIDKDQRWLDNYELEVYLLYKVIKLGYKVTEAPVSKIYPPKSLGYTKMKPITGWWSILRPIFLLWLGIKK
ncbi:MAG: glycosyltransferase family 2 protein [Candidatus Omnitrophota bacterium]